MKRFYVCHQGALEGSTYMCDAKSAKEAAEMCVQDWDPTEDTRLIVFSETSGKRFETHQIMTVLPT